LVDKKKLQQRVAELVNAYDESLEAAEQPRLTEGQRGVLQAFLEILYSKSRPKQGLEIPQVD
jgi:hypothetical protein